MQVTINFKDKAISKVSKWFNKNLEAEAAGFTKVEQDGIVFTLFTAEDGSTFRLGGGNLIQETMLFSGARETFIKTMAMAGIEGNKAFYAAVDTYVYQETKAKFIRPWQLLSPERKAEMEEKEAVYNFYKNLDSSMYPEEVKMVIREEKEFDKKTLMFSMLSGLSDFDKTMKEIKSIKSLSPRNQENRIKWLNANHPGWEVLKGIAFKVKLKEEPKRKARVVEEEAPKSKKKK